MAGTPARRDLEDRLVALRKANHTLNTVWSEKARTLVQPALEAVNTRYFRQLAGSLRFVNTKVPVLPAPKVKANSKAKPDAVVLPAPVDPFIGPPAPPGGISTCHWSSKTS